MLSFEGERRLRDLLYEVMLLEQRTEYFRDDLCRMDSFEPYSAFQKIANSSNKKYIYVEDIQRFLRENRFNQHYENCLLFIKQYESYKNSFHLSYSEFLESVFPVMNTRIREEAAQRDKEEFTGFLPFVVEQDLSELINYEVNHLMKLDRLKGELRDSDIHFSPINCFKTIDQQAIGFIDDDAISNFMIKNGIVLTQNQTYFIVRRINQNKSGKITLDEFSSFILMQNSSQYNKKIDRTRAYSLNLSNNLSDKFDFQLSEQQQQYLRNKNIPLNLSKKQINSHTDLQQSQETIILDSQSQSYPLLSSQMYNKNNQNKEDEERFAWTTAKKTEQQPLDQSNENLKNQQNVQIKKYYSAQKPQPQSPELTNLSKQREMISGTNPTKTRNQVITNKDQSNVSMTQSNLNNQNYQELAKNNNFNDNEEYKKQQQIMMGSTAQSFYASNTQNKFQKSTVQSNNRHQFDIFRYSNNGFGHSIPKQKCVLDSNSNSKFQTEFISFLQDLLQISEIDKNIESAKLEFLGLINFSISNLFDYIDKQKKNTIVYEEFKNFIQSELSLKSFSSNECNIIFQHFDLQSRGMISKEDLKKKLKPLDPFIVFQQPYLIISLLSEAEKQKLKNYFKAILSGHSKINEIKKHYSNRNARTFNSLSLSELFNKLDHDNDSCISLYDVQNVFEEENIKITKDNINHIFQRFDQPNLTPITFSDFIKEFSSHKI